MLYVVWHFGRGKKIMKKEKISAKDKKLLGEIQGDLPLCLTPFGGMARKAGWKEEDLLRRIRGFIRRGMIRRFGAILRHQKAGYQGNAMAVWKVREGQVSRVSRMVASFAAVSHCYLRTPLPEWPFNLYTMIHGRNEEDCRRIAGRISRKTGLRHYRLLFSRREHKKSSMAYF
jgi:DNA-binding Lrp family transcriptional regulator